VIAAELGPEFVGVGALQLLEYAQRLLPGVPGPTALPPQPGETITARRGEALAQTRCR